MPGDGFDLTAQLAHELERQKQHLRSIGFGQPLGIGRMPAIVVIDLIYAFTNPGSPQSAPLDQQIDATRTLLHAARARSIPIFLTTIEYDASFEEAGVFGRKTAMSLNHLVRGTDWVAIDDRLEVAESDQILVKKYPSCFFGTDLTSRLVTRGVDTLLIAGCTTSGCVRATAVDACSLGFRPIVVEEAVGDRAPISHLASLFDIDCKYGDVMKLAPVMHELSQRASPSQAAD
jgi:maleamate amidohydrolase